MRIERLARAALAFAAALAAGAAGAQQMASRVWAGADAPAFAFRAPALDMPTVVALAEVKSAAAAPASRGQKVGTVRGVAKDSAVASWTPVAGGWVARLRVASPGAAGLRARLALPAGAEGSEVVAQGTHGGPEGAAAGDALAWTPWTPGETQEIELFSRTAPAGAPAVEAIVHFDVEPFAKATAGTCSPDVACTSGEAARDAAIAERRNAVALVNFVEGTEARVCTGTLLNTEKFPTPYMVTANHCIATAAAAGSVTTLWFHEAASCGASTVNPAARQLAGGATLVFTSHGADSTLLQLKGTPPAGAVFSGWSAEKLAEGEAVVSVSHPQGDVKKFALGTVRKDLQVRNYPQLLHGVSFSRGVTEGGSSGSGLFTLASGSLQLRGVLSGSTLRTGSALSCANADEEEAIYGRFEIFHPQIAGYIAAVAPNRADDYGNRITEAQRIFPVAQAVPTEVAYEGRIDYPGDVDVFRVDVPQAGGTLTLRTAGGTDTIGTLLDATGKTIRSVNDAQSDGPDFGLTRTLAAGSYHVAIAHHDPQGTGAYSLRASLSTVTDNYTDLWWNPAEPGWGLNINHQGQTLFVTLFTYDRDRRPLWLVASSVTRQPTGYWQGQLLRMSGPAFNATPWGATTATAVGTVRITFTSASKATLSYSVDGVSVSKPIERQVFSVPPTCRWSAFDRSLTTNFQDLWWNPAEPGWGMNIAHQGNILFATLFTYDLEGRGRWLVMSRGERIADGLYIGELYQTAGPPFNATPWTPATTTQAGTLSVQFTRGNAATITYTIDGFLVVKPVERQVFGIPATECVAPAND
ncbi:MAG: DVUA0089 family protein [Burkholderiales bacterium]|nr:DVUA0089 family protein [Burkholderiales bacterium]